MTFFPDRIKDHTQEASTCFVFPVPGAPQIYDKEDDIPPSIATMGAFPFMRYVAAGVLMQCVVFYMLEIFSFFSITDTLINIAGSTVLSFLIIWAIESIRRTAVRK